jgi:hypothetical protein
MKNSEACVISAQVHALTKRQNKVEEAIEKLNRKLDMKP